MTKKVLIVDDEPDILTTVKMLVEAIGYQAITVDGGKKAVTLLQKEKFDLVLLDMLMPEMTGREVMEWIRGNPKLKGQKVAFLTVVQLSGEGKRIVQKLKPDDYINKPIDNTDFKKRVRKLLGD